MRKLWFAALIAAALAVVTVALPVIANQKNAAEVAKSRDVGEPAVSGALPSHRASMTPAATVPPKATTTTVPSKTPASTPPPTPKPKSTTTPPATTTTTTKTPAAPAPDESDAGPAVAGPCSGVLIKPGQNAQSIVNSKPAGTTFCFAAGLHRITETIRPKADTTLASDEHAVLTGSVPLTDWTRSGAAWVTRGVLPAAYGMSGQCEDDKANICHLREQVFVDGRHLTRVASVAEVKTGTFYADYTANAIHLGTDPAGRSVEMSKTRTAIESGASGVVVRGLTIEHFASAPQAGALVAGPGWKVTANDVRWNHAVGVMLVKADNTRVEENLIRNNGQLGLGQYASAAATVSRNVITGNNTDGFWIADWESGGIKSTRSSGTVSRNLIKANKGVGMWADVADDGRVISSNTITGNAADGIRYEISRNGTIENNTISGNGFGAGRGSGTSLWDGGGININTSTGVTVRNNVVSGNVNGVTIQSRTRGTGPWGAYLLRDVRVAGNTIEMTGGTQSTGLAKNSGAEVPAGEVVFSGNKYVLDALGAQRFSRFGTKLTAAGWKQAGLDAVGSFLAN